MIASCRDDNLTAWDQAIVLVPGDTRRLELTVSISGRCQQTIHYRLLHGGL